MSSLSTMRRIAKIMSPYKSVFIPHSLGLVRAPRVPSSLASVSPHYQYRLMGSSTYLKSSPLQVYPHSATSRDDCSTVGRKQRLPSIAKFSSVAACLDPNPTDSVKEIYDKILASVNVKRTMSPNAWLWSLIATCQNREDIKLLFDALQNLRRFRLSNLRIHQNFNCHLCEETVKACLRVGAFDFGKMALRKHNVYGLTPTVGSANRLLSYAKDQRDANFLDEGLDIMNRNEIDLQPSTADTVLSACSGLNDWALMSKYSKMFIDRGIKLRKTSFDVWMNLAAKRGDIKVLWEIEKLRSKLSNRHTILSGFANAKGLILERKPLEASAIILSLCQTLPENKRSEIDSELQRLVNEWPFDVVKFYEENKKKDLINALKSDIPSMISTLLSANQKFNVNIEEFSKKDIAC